MLDGPDGCGKSTQTARLAKTLSDRHPEKKIITTREPGGTSAGEKIRNTLLRHYPEGSSLYPETEVYLFFAARAQLVREVIKPAMENDEIVICERWVSSTQAYQGHAGNIPLEEIDRTGRLALEGCKPDLLLILDVNSEEGLRRLQGDVDRIEAKSLHFHEQVRKGFHKIVKQQNNAFLIPAGQIEDTAILILKEVERVI